MKFIILTLLTLNLISCSQKIYDYEDSRSGYWVRVARKEKEINSNVFMFDREDVVYKLYVHKFTKHGSPLLERLYAMGVSEYVFERALSDNYYHNSELQRKTEQI